MSNGSESLCPYCMTPIQTDQAVTCDNCSAPHHAACLAENSGCAVLGCRARNQARTPVSGPNPTYPRTVEPDATHTPAAPVHLAADQPMGTNAYPAEPVPAVPSAATPSSYVSTPPRQAPADPTQGFARVSESTPPPPYHAYAPPEVPATQTVQPNNNTGRGFLWSALAAVSMIALLALGSVGALLLANSSEETAVETANDPIPQERESEGTPTRGESAGTTAPTDSTPTHVEAPSGTECSYMTAPAVGEYIVILDPSEPLYQSNTSPSEACNVASGNGGDVLDSSKYWNLNLDNGHKGLWTLFSGSYDTKSTAEDVAVSYGYDPYGSDSWRVRWIGPCDRGDGYACVP